MTDNLFMPGGNEPPRDRGRRRTSAPGSLPDKLRSSALLIPVLILLGVLVSWSIYTQFRIDVGRGEMAILIRKTGKDMQNGSEIAESPEHKGVQREYLTEGRYFRNPFVYDWEILEQKVIPADKIGVLVSLTGDNLPYGEFLAKVDAQGNPLTKGIMPGVLNSGGRYFIHPYLFELELHDPVMIPAGFKGVKTNLAGPLPETPNTLLVPEGFRGVQEKPLDARRHDINPYEERISLVDCRSQRFNLADNKDMGFPSKDGFWVGIDGIIEFRIQPEKAAEVYVIYHEDGDGEALSREIVNKVIMPNARSFCRLEGSGELGRDLIGGETRIQFQEQFQQAMRDECEPAGIEIIQALITRIVPPQQIAELVQQREIAKQNEKQYQQQILQQDSEQKLMIEVEMANQLEAKVQADQKIIKITTEAMQKQEVELTQANQKLEVAKLKLDAAKDEAEAIVARGKAEAEVIRLQNAAIASGWQRSVEAFSGDGAQFSRYVMYQKLSASYRRLMINTADSPIMKIFEGFAPSNSPPTPGVAAPAANPSPMTTAAP